MCRIAAIVSSELDNLESGIKKITQIMHRGGPDHEGILVNPELGYALGHRRLSIIDISDQGNQPMNYLNERYEISFNGEIYNFKELKAELAEMGYLFNTNSDTEVILAGFAAWKEDMLIKLQGMFAFIIIDKETATLFAARDSMGIKPLYFGKKGGEFYFSSEVKGFLAIDSNWEVNLEWPVWFLTFGFLPEPVTTLQNVCPLPKGHYLKMDLYNHHFEKTCWFKPHFCDTSMDSDAAINKTRQLVEDAVKRHLIADVEVGVFLSGGVDSSILTLLAAKNSNTQIRTLSIDFEDDLFSERKYQELIIKKAGTNHQNFIVKESDFVQQWKEIFESLDQPTTDAINSHFICKYAHEAGLKVVLSGLGADELFGGYPSFHRTAIFKKLQRLSLLFHGLPEWSLKYPNKKIEFLKNKISGSEYLLYRGLFTPADVAAILHITEKEVWKIIGNYQLPEAVDNLKHNPKTKVSILETDIYMLNQLLKDSDTQSMWFGLELRVPFLDKELVDFLFRLPDGIKYPQDKHKYLLVEAFKDLLPVEIWNRKKQGFTFPFDIWMKKMKAFENHWYVPEKYYLDFKKGKINASRLWGIYLAKTLGNVKTFDESPKTVNPNILFTYLAAFSKTGGIEKMNRIIMHCLLPENEVYTETIALHDGLMDNRYFPRYYFKGFSGRKIRYILHLMFNARKWNHVIVGHLNISSAIWLMRLFNSSLRIWVITHGIEAWSKQNLFRAWMLKKAETIISVSQYTKDQLIEISGIESDKIIVLPNCIDPFFTVPIALRKPRYLCERYNIKHGTRIIFTLNRMNANEKYKGYDKVINALGEYVKTKHLPFKYILAGNADNIERKRIQHIIEITNLTGKVIMPGFLSLDEIQDHYQLADLFIMPSKKEGFGIVFIESAVCGTPVIAGNSDGSKEALLNGGLGSLIDPDNAEELLSVLKRELLNNCNSENLQKMALRYYQFDYYKNQFLSFIKNGK